MTPWAPGSGRTRRGGGRPPDTGRDRTCARHEHDTPGRVPSCPIDPYGFRAPTPDDLEPVAAVLVADQRADDVPPVLDARFIDDVWSRPGFDLGADAWVVTDRVGTIVAYGQVRQEEPDIVGSWGVVHPEHRGRRIGPSLFDRIEARASELLAGVPAPRFRHSINAADLAATAMLRDRGLRPVRHFWHMQIDLDGAVEPGPAPDGIERSAGSSRPAISRRSTPSSRKRSRTTGATTPARTIAGSRRR